MKKRAKRKQKKVWNYEGYPYDSNPEAQGNKCKG